MASFHHPHRRQRPQGSANGGAADAKLRDEVAFRRQAVAGPEMTASDQIADVRDHVIGARTRRPCCHSGRSYCLQIGQATFKSPQLLVVQPRRAWDKIRAALGG